MRSGRLSLAALVVAALAALAPAAARAHGDPAGDYLAGQNVYLSFHVKVPPTSRAQLEAVVDESWKLGYRVRVAVIGDRSDLGDDSSLFVKPQEYARSLGRELLFAYKGTLLVVMPSGYGVSRRGRALSGELQRLTALQSPTAAKTDLATAAIGVVRQLAESRGIHLPVPRVAPPESTRTSDRLKIVLAAVVVFCAVGGAVAARRRAHR